MSAPIAIEPMRDVARGRRRAEEVLPSARGLTHEVATTFGDVTDLRKAWNGLLALTGGDVFATFDWCEAWWRHYGEGRRLQIHLFYDADRLVGVVPLFSESLGIGPPSLSVLRLVGCDHSVSTCGLAVLPEVAEEAFCRILGHDEVIRCHALSFGPLAGYGPLAPLIANELRRSEAYSVHLQTAAPQMLFDVPETYEKFLESLPKKRRYEFRIEEKRCQTMGELTWRICAKPADLDRAFSEFRQLHQEYWVQQGQLSHFGDWPRSTNFHRAVIASQAKGYEPFFCETRLNGQLIASEYCLQFGSRVHWFLTARRPDIGGRVGFAAMVRECCRRGITQIDGMCGYYDYKKWMGARLVEQKRVLAVRRELLPRLRAAMFQRGAQALNLLYYRLWFSRIAPRIPWRSRKPLWKTWIRSRI